MMRCGILRIDEVSNRFGLKQVQFAIQHCTPREFSRFCQSRACGNDRTKNCDRNDDSSVGADLESVLACVGVRCEEHGRDCAIYHTPDYIMHDTPRRMPYA